MSKPYGELPGEMDVVELMIELRESGLGYQAIANWLNTQRVPTRHNAIWWPLTVRDILVRHRPDLCPPRQPLPVPQHLAHDRYRDHQRRLKHLRSRTAVT